LLILAFSVAMLLSACGFLSKQPPAAKEEDDVPTTTKSTFVPPETSKETEPVTSEEITEPVHEHTWVEATFQEPKTCSVCFQTEGSPLPAAFETSGYPINMIVGPTYDYKTIGFEDSSQEIIGQVTLTEYLVVSSTETHEAKEGYEWKIIHVNSSGDSAAMQEYGSHWRETVADYYTGDRYLDKEITSFDLNGEEAECYVEFTSIRGGWENHVFYYEYEYAVQTPIGYDGCVLVIYNAANAVEEAGTYEDTVSTLADLVDEDSLFFRLGNV
jgi:hypothetical protein